MDNHRRRPTLNPDRSFRVVGGESDPQDGSERKRRAVVPQPIAFRISFALVIGWLCFLAYVSFRTLNP